MNNTHLTNTAALVGRILLAVIFIKAGWGKIAGFEGTAGYMASKGLPMVQVLLVLTILVELGGGILLAVGWKARWAALVIAATADSKSADGSCTAIAARPCTWATVGMMPTRRPFRRN